MPFRQTYYTSCEQGLRGGKGFQINAASDGLAPSLLEQIQRLGLYVPPVSAPSRPTAEEMERFPVAFLYQTLGDGSAVIARAKYVGADYSGRPGNYFTHSLVTADLERDLGEAGLLPIELWGAPLWSTTESPSLTLPALARPEAGGVINPERVSRFLSEGGRMGRLPAFLTAAHRALATGRRILFVEDSQATALWVAAASYALSRRLALRLTFNTYVKNPYQNDFLLVGTTSDSDFGFAPHEIEHKFYVLDFEGGRFTEVGEISPFARLAAALYAAGRAETVAAFAAFAARVAPDLGLEELDAAFACHARREGVEVTAADGVRVLGWCARRIGGFTAEELRDLAAAVAGASSAGDILDAYTDLYLASLGDSSRADLPRLVELPYLEWLIRVAALEAPLPELERAAARLRARPSPPGQSSGLALSWVKQVRHCSDARRLPALFQIADRLGFLHAGDESLHLVGEAVVGPALAEPPTIAALVAHAGSPGVRRVLDGAGSYLAAQVDSPDAFRPLADALSRPEIYQELVRYAFEQGALGLYFRLVCARLPHAPTNPRQRLDAFLECIAGVKRVAPELPGALVENAFDASWQSALPSFDEAVELLDLLEHLKVEGTSIPKRLVALVETCDLAALEGKQQELVNRLSARNKLHRTLGEKAAVVDAYRIPAELELSGEALPGELKATLKFLEAQTGLSRAIVTRAYDVVAAYLVLVKDPDAHARLLLRAFSNAGGREFLEAYGRAVVAALRKPSSARPKAAAWLARAWTAAEKDGAKYVASALFDEHLPQAVGGWRSKELELVERELKGDPPALRRWHISREAAKEQGGSGVAGFFGKLIGRNRGAKDS